MYYFIYLFTRRFAYFAFTAFCNFDVDLCDFEQSTDDDVDWTRQRGGTPSDDTGPDGDRTNVNGKGNVQKVAYMN